MQLHHRHHATSPLAEDEDDDEEEPAFLPSSPQTSRPPTAGRADVPPTTGDTGEGTTREGGGVGAAGKEDSGPGSDSFSDLSDASISKSALEEALEEHLRRGGSVAGSQMQSGAAAGVRSIWKGKFTGS